MEGPWLIAVFSFVAGFVADLARKTFLPASSEWLGQKIPSVRREQNAERNLLTLQVMKQLEELGQDPALAEHISDDANKFLARIMKTESAYINAKIASLEEESSPYVNMTQVVMTEEAARRAEIADRQLQEAVAALLSDHSIDEWHRDKFHDAQDKWVSYREAQATLEGDIFIGGSMRPVVYWATYEALTIERSGAVRTVHEELTGGLLSPSVNT